ncbi:equilibrative nucleoside transporter 1 [Danaus plexippus plexippus]|uniref:Equilibrative nucleoside transporter 1 n=1 Tax=Danaus plexippus plexippus TaxID=278856 RepID=A0A212ERJ8_DANPL|nr:equilibrative nucleoside transporter 1 [Danaus plexippus plexippus]
MLARVYDFPTNQWVIASLSVLRVVGVPLLMLCNAQPRQHLPVLFPWDYQYITIMIVFAFTNGYLTNIIMMLRWSTASRGNPRARESVERDRHHVERGSDGRRGGRHAAGAAAVSWRREEMA